jgi:hypothetical protein
MADFAPNVTARYRLHYNVIGRQHAMVIRGARGTTFAQMQIIGQGVLHDFFNAMAILLTDDLAFVAAEVALTDSDLFFPANLPTAVVGTVGIATASKQDSITHLTFSGRGSLGSKVSLKLYGVQLGPDALPENLSSDFVILASEHANVASAITVLNQAQSAIVAVDNSKPVFAQRVTIKVNDFWLRRVRQGL